MATASHRSNRSIILAAVAWLGLTCAAALIMGGAWFLHGAASTASASVRGGASVPAAGAGDPPWT